jgi:hypothetical protein
MGELALAGCLGRSPFGGRIPAILEEAHRLYFEKPAKRLSAT